MIPGDPVIKCSLSSSDLSKSYSKSANDYLHQPSPGMVCNVTHCRYNRLLGRAARIEVL